MAVEMVQRTWADDSGGDRVSLEEAVIRLAGYGFERETAARLLREGTMLRTPFAFYRIIKPDETEAEGRAAWGDR